MNVTLTNDEYARLAVLADQQDPPQLIEQYAANLIRDHL